MSVRTHNKWTRGGGGCFYSYVHLFNNPCERRTLNAQSIAVAIYPGSNGNNNGNEDKNPALFIRCYYLRLFFRQAIHTDIFKNRLCFGRVLPAERFLLAGVIIWVVFFLMIYPVVFSVKLIL